MLVSCVLFVLVCVGVACADTVCSIIVSCSVAVVVMI